MFWWNFHVTVSHKTSISWNLNGFQQYGNKSDLRKQEVVQCKVLWRKQLHGIENKVWIQCYLSLLHVEYRDHKLHSRLQFFREIFHITVTQTIVIRNGKTVWRHGLHCCYFFPNFKYLGWLYRAYIKTANNDNFY